MEALPWPAITAATGGWALFGLLSWRLFTMMMNGTLVPQREVDAKDKEIGHLRSIVSELSKQQSLVLGSSVPTTTSLLELLKERVEEADSA